ncbi:hypothetical protein HJFPF1_12810 [Paramyrothecium foliicola]|nr:hypothetical protein HJFPF1_12810 [Paramyrothecium foliicola]
MSPSALKHEESTMDSISKLSDPLSSMSSLSSLVSLLALAYNIRDPSPSKQGRLTTLLKTISPEPRPPKSRTYSNDEMIDSFVNFLSPVLNGMAGMEDFEAAVDGFSQPDNFRDFWTFEGHNLIRDMSEGDSHGHVMKGSDTFLDVFSKDLSCRVAYGRDTGRLILVPGAAELQDEIRLGEDGKLKLVRELEGKWSEVSELHSNDW